MNIPPSPGTTRMTIKVDDFRHAATLGDQLCLKFQGDSSMLVATGTTPSGRSVAWVAAPGDVTSVFVAAIAERYGVGLSRMVADELGLQPAQGKPLSSRIVMEALSMAESIRTALDGVRFAESLLQQSGEAKPSPATPDR